MTYTLNNFDGSFFANIPDGTLNNSTSLTFVGKNYAGYGGILDENYLYLMQNFAAGSQPPKPVPGQLWWNNNSNVLNIYTGVTFKSFAGSTSANIAPSTANAVTGDLWFNPQADVLYVFSGTSWIAVGPSVSNGTGAVSDTIPTTTGGSQHIIKFIVDNKVVGVIADATFVPAETIPGIPEIYPGLTLSGNIGSTGNMAAIIMDAPISAGGSFGSPGYVLASGGNTSSVYWAPTSSGGNIGIQNVGSNTANANISLFPMFSNISSGQLSTAFVSNTGLTFNPATGTLSAKVIQSTGGILLNANIISTPQTIPAGYNGVSAGPMTIAAGGSVTIDPSSSWSIV